MHSTVLNGLARGRAVTDCEFSVPFNSADSHLSAAALRSWLGLCLEGSTLEVPDSAVYCPRKDSLRAGRGIDDGQTAHRQGYCMKRKGGREGGS